MTRRDLVYDYHQIAERKEKSTSNGNHDIITGYKYLYLDAVSVLKKVYSRLELS